MLYTYIRRFDMMDTVNFLKKIKHGQRICRLRSVAGSASLHAPVLRAIRPPEAARRAAVEAPGGVPYVRF